MNSTPENLMMLDLNVAMLCVVSVQLCVLLLVATLLARCLKRSATLVNRVWFTTVVLATLLLPLQGLGIGWNLSLELLVTHNSIAKLAPTSQRDTISRTALNEDSIRPIDSPLSQSTQLPNLSADELLTSPRDEHHKLGSTNEPASIRTSGIGSTSLSSTTWLPVTIVTTYGLVVSVCLLRLISRIHQLKVIFRRGQSLGESATKCFDSFATRLAIRQPVAVRMSQEIAMPMTFGWLRPKVLVPCGYEQWSDEEQRLVAAHELAHISRNDWAAEIWAELVTAIYWFHPAAWIILGKLRQSREAAADELVIHSGFAATTYARHFVAVLERLNTASASADWHPAVSMSLYQDVETRLHAILNVRTTRPPRRISLVAVASLLLVIALTCVRLVAQPPIASATQASSATSTASTPARSQVASKKSLAENDLLEQLLNAEPVTVSDQEAGYIVSVTGIVRATSGQPVPGAIVCLCESSVLRSYRQSGRFDWIPEQSPDHQHDVLARTTTDTDGRYEFKSIKAPSLGESRGSGWKGHVLAGNPDVGLGWSDLELNDDRIRHDDDHMITLLPTVEVGGVYQGVDGQPLAGIQLSLIALNDAIPENSPFNARARRLELTGGQLMPTCTTNDQGEFRFRGVPRGSAAIVHAPGNGQYSSSLAGIATDPNLQQPSRIDRITRYDPKELLSANCVWIADPGVHFHGRVVDASGSPVGKVQVSCSSADRATSTDADGRFDLHIPTAFTRPSTDNRFYLGSIEFVPPEITDLLPQTTFLAVKQSKADPKPPIKLEDINEVKLESAVRVRGQVIDTDGGPVKDIVIQEHSSPKTQGRQLARTTTGEDGFFEVLLSRGEHTLHYSAPGPGIDLPHTSQRSINAQIEQAKLPHIDIDVSDGQPITLQPIRVSRVPAFEVLVRLPDGQPAVGADVVLWQHREASPLVNGMVPPPQVIDMFTPEDREISAHVKTNERGLATILPIGKLQPGAALKATLAAGDKTLVGEIISFQQSNRLPEIYLQAPPKVEGRVLFNGQPVAGATVRVDIHQQTSGTVVVLRNPRYVKTDSEGKYSLPGEVGCNYYASFESGPGVPAIRTGTSFARRVGPELMRIPTIAIETPTAELTGTVIDATGKPVEGALIQIETSDTLRPDWWVGHEASSQKQTDAKGRFKLKNIRPGKYSLFVSSTNSRPKGIPPKFDVSTDMPDVQLILK